VGRNLSKKTGHENVFEIVKAFLGEIKIGRWDDGFAMMSYGMMR
jgi:hypothetical protein